MSKLSRVAAATLLLLPSAAPRAQSLPEGAVNVSAASGISDRPAAVADAGGRLHVAWADDPGSDELGAQRVYYARAAGAAFEQPRRLSAGVDEGVPPEEIRIAASPSGAVVVAWWASVDDGGRPVWTAFVARSVDGGETFAPARQTSLRVREGGANKEGFSNTTRLSLALGPEDEIYLLATIADYRRGFNVYFARSADGESFSEPLRVSSYSNPIPRATSNALAVLADGRVYAAWTEGHGDFFDETKVVLFAVSSDGGRTFGAPRGAGGASGAVAAVLAADGATHLLTQVKRTPRSRGVIKLNRSTNGGERYSARAIIAKAAGHSHLHQASLARRGDVVAVAWVENSPRPVPEDGVYVATSRDGGRTFDAARLVARGLFPDPPAVVVDSGGRVGVVFTSEAAAPQDREVLFLAVEP